MRRLARVAFDYLRHVLSFLMASSGVAALVTFALPFVGYATYGDRPGPGWYGLPSGISWNDVGELAGMASALPLFGALPTLLFFLVPYAAVRACERTGARRPLIQALGGLLCFLVGSLVVAGAGWYIALGALAGWAGALGGLAYGAFGLPRRVARSVGAPGRDHQAAVVT